MGNSIGPQSHSRLRLKQVHGERVIVGGMGGKKGERTVRDRLGKRVPTAQVATSVFRSGLSESTHGRISPAALAGRTASYLNLIQALAKGRRARRGIQF